MDLPEEQNPLQVSIQPIYSQPTSHTNCPGRPKKKNEIRFGPQPESIVSQLLKAQKLQLTKQTEKHNDEDTSTAEITNEPEPKKYKSDEIKIHQCDYPSCEYTTKSSSNMIKHKRRHTAEKPYMCDQCSFRTNFINSLNVHKRIHTGERPFICEHCSYRCNSSSNLKKHHMHKHSGVT